VSRYDLVYNIDERGFCDRLFGQVVVTDCCDKLFVQVWCMVDALVHGTGSGTVWCMVDATVYGKG
jgi:hypothetical protein